METKFLLLASAIVLLNSPTFAMLQEDTQSTPGVGVHPHKVTDGEAEEKQTTFTPGFDVEKNTDLAKKVLARVLSPLNPDEVQSVKSLASNTFPFLDHVITPDIWLTTRNFLLQQPNLPSALELQLISQKVKQNEDFYALERKVAFTPAFNVKQHLETAKSVLNNMKPDESNRHLYTSLASNTFPFLDSVITPDIWLKTRNFLLQQPNLPSDLELQLISQKVKQNDDFYALERKVAFTPAFNVKQHLETAKSVLNNMNPDEINRHLYTSLAKDTYSLLEVVHDSILMEKLLPFIQ